MSWVTLSLLAALLYAVVYVLDKIILTRYQLKPQIAIAVSCLTTAIFFIPLSLTRGNINLPPAYILLGLAAGVVNGLAIFLYYRVMAREEVSRLVPILSLTPAFVFVLSFLFLNERFTAPIYLGIFLIIFGSLLISLKKSSAKVKLNLSLFLTIMSAVFLALGTS